MNTKPPKYISCGLTLIQLDGSYNYHIIASGEDTQILNGKGFVECNEIKENHLVFIERYHYALDRTTLLPKKLKIGKDYSITILEGKGFLVKSSLSSEKTGFDYVIIEKEL